MKNKKEFNKGNAFTVEGNDNYIEVTKPEEQQMKDKENKMLAEIDRLKKNL